MGTIICDLECQPVRKLDYIRNWSGKKAIARNVLMFLVFFIYAAHDINELSILKNKYQHCKQSEITGSCRITSIFTLGIEMPMDILWFSAAMSLFILTFVSQGLQCFLLSTPV